MDATLSGEMCFSVSRVVKGASPTRGILVVVLLAAASCGTRVDHSVAEKARSVEGGHPLPVAGDGAEVRPEAPPLASNDPVTAAGAERGSVKETPSKARSGPVAPAAAGNVAAAESQASRVTPTTENPAGATGMAPGDSGSGGTGGAVGNVPGGVVGHSTVNVASVGTYSGPVGTALTPMLQGAQLWVKHINGKGGLNGHLVKLVVYDDGADTARHRAQVQQAVERQHVIAFLMNAEVFTGAGSIDYLNAKRVPVVGVSGGEPWAYSSPMYFPQLSTGDGFARSAVPSFAQQAIPKGKTRLATLVCVEASGCDPVDNKMAEMAKQYGFEHVYRARVTVTQPDYTAECLAARNQRAEILVPILDTNSVRRVAASCARQGYHPIFGLPGTVVDHKMKDDPNLEGAIAWTNVFPYFQSGTAATDEFQKALRTYGEGIPLGMGPPTGWVAGKLLEKAGAGLPEPPTSEALLSGLWSLQNDTLGDLTLPLTFTRDQVPPLLVCWFDFTISGRTFLSPDRFKRHCL